MMMMIPLTVISPSFVNNLLRSTWDSHVYHALSPQVKLFPPLSRGEAVRFRLFQVQSRRSKGEDPFLKRCFFDMFVLCSTTHEQVPLWMYQLQRCRSTYIC